MKVIVLYRPKSEHCEQVEEFINNYTTAGSTSKLETINIDTRDGNSIAMLYDVTRYPAILVVRDDGILQKLWEGMDLPRVDDVNGYLLA
jgi:thioredoxin-like negative regulator of GroEL